jgi:hypothetical protein
MKDWDPTAEDRRHPAARALEAALRGCAGALAASQVAVAACIYPRRPDQADPGPWPVPGCWGHNDRRPIYPASVMKLFVLAAMAGLQQEGRFAIGGEDARAARAMIRLSSNEATAYLMGRLSGAFDGPPLDEAALALWLGKRAIVQDWFLSRGQDAYAGLQLLHATYQDSPYGRAFQARQPGNGNRLSARAGAALMHDIVRGAMAGRDWMLDLLDRDFQRGPGYRDAEGDQVRGFLAEGLPPEVRVWSKAGHTSKTRHDLLYGVCPDGRAFVLCVMTEGAWPSANATFLPALARHFHHEAFGPGASAPMQESASPTLNDNTRHGGRP